VADQRGPAPGDGPRARPGCGRARARGAARLLLRTEPRAALVARA
jgi:hypothetical protein